jgi:hypothetical protein
MLRYRSSFESDFLEPRTRKDSNGASVLVSSSWRNPPPNSGTDRVKSRPVGWQPAHDPTVLIRLHHPTNTERSVIRSSFGVVSVSLPRHHPAQQQPAGPTSVWHQDARNRMAIGQLGGQHTAWMPLQCPPYPQCMGYIKWSIIPLYRSITIQPKYSQECEQGWTGTRRKRTICRDFENCRRAFPSLGCPPRLATTARSRYHLCLVEPL